MRSFVAAVMLGGVAAATPPAVSSSTSASRPPLHRHLAEAPVYPIAAGKGSAAIFFSAAAGAPEASLALLSLQPGARVPEHVHEKSVELLYILEGEVEMSVAGEGFRAGAGTALRVPVNTRHGAAVVGKVPLKALQVYGPAGPEQRFVPPGR